MVKTTPVQTTFVIETTTNSTNALKTSTNPTTTPKKTSAPSNAVDSAQITTHFTISGEKSQFTSEIPNTEHSQTQVVSSNQTTGNLQNTAVNQSTTIPPATVLKTPLPTTIQTAPSTTEIATTEELIASHAMDSITEIT